MTKVVSRPLPHRVGTAEVADAQLKSVAMRFMENFRSVAAQLAEVQAAVRELQTRAKEA